MKEIGSGIYATARSEFSQTLCKTDLPVSGKNMSCFLQSRSPAPRVELSLDAAGIFLRCDCKSVTVHCRFGTPLKMFFFRLRALLPGRSCSAAGRVVAGDREHCVRRCQILPCTVEQEKDHALQQKTAQAAALQAGAGCNLLDFGCSKLRRASLMFVQLLGCCIRADVSATGNPASMSAFLGWGSCTRSQNISLALGVISHARNHDKIAMVRKTWLFNESVMFFSNVSDEGVGTIYVPDDSQLADDPLHNNHGEARFLRARLYLSQAFQAEWYMLVDDDTYVFLPCALHEGDLAPAKNSSNQAPTSRPQRLSAVPSGRLEVIAPAHVFLQVTGITVPAQYH